MIKKLIDNIQEINIKYLAIIGLAKNAGKTVTFNTIVKEARSKGLKLSLFSYGRDGEEIDSLTLKKKPRIFVPPGNIFATAEKAYYASAVNGNLLVNTGFKTLLGEVNLYQLGNKGGYIELVGINSTRQLQQIEKFIPSDVDLVLIDGALDRRSSAIPTLAEGIILATGAVVANTEDLVVEKTLYEIKRLNTQEIDNELIKRQTKGLYSKSTSGIIDQDGYLHEIDSKTSFSFIEKLKKFKTDEIKVIILQGALVNSFAEELVYSLKVRDCILLVRDGTRIFIDRKNFNLLAKNKIRLNVLNGINIVGVTVNPVSPYGVRLNSRLIINQLRRELDSIPVYDLMSEEYYH